MIKFKKQHDLKRIRRLALASQGLLKTAPFGRGLAGARKAINHIGYVQIDTISVVERAHHHVLHSRVPGFKPAMMDQLLARCDIFEYWAHAAAFLPINDFRYSLPYKQAIKAGQVHWYKNPDRKLMSELLARIRSDGPLRSRDVESGDRKRGEWWDWKPAKKALEQLFMQGDLMVSDRTGFQKTYDLTERVLPAETDTTLPTVDEFAEHILDQQLRCHGLVSLKGLTYLRRNTELRQAIKTLVQERLDARTLETVVLNDTDIYYLEPECLDSALPRAGNRLLILSPFDNSVIQRERLNALFGYAYQLECYKPAAQRQFGYFCLPLLYRGEFIGRMDCKAHRKNRHLEVRSLHLDPHPFKPGPAIEALGEAIARFMQFQDCDSVSIEPSHPLLSPSTLNDAIALN